MSELSSVCVYCGSSPGSDPVYMEAARSLGHGLADSGVQLVYGGGEVGLMGAVADAVMERGGSVLGVIPKGLFTREVKHTGLTELIETTSMHERKQIMADRSEAFVAMPGGFGTLEELAEVTTWAQLGMHNKPIALLDTNGFWSPLIDFIDGAIASGFVKQANRDLISVVRSPEEVLPALSAYDVAYVDKWLER